MKEFDVFEEVETTPVSQEVIDSAIKTRFHTKDKVSEVRARLIVQDYWREVDDRYDIYVSTPLLTMAKIMLLVALQFGFGIVLGDISTAFLHANMDYDFYVWPPKECHTGRDVLWKLKKALYGLKEAPRAWQEHFAEVLQIWGGKRLKADSTLYYFKD